MSKKPKSDIRSSHGGPVAAQTAATEADSPPLVGIEASDWDMLDQRLLRAAISLRVANDEGAQREAWAEALIATLDFLRNYQDRPPVNQMFVELIGALGDLNEGRQPASLRPSAIKPRRSRSNKAIMDQASAVAMIDALVRAGDDEHTAGTRIATLAVSLGCELPNPQHRSGKDQTPDHVRLLNWRKELGRAGRDPRYAIARDLRLFWRRRLKDYVAKHGCDPKSGAEAMIEMWTCLHRPK
ncbi:MAG: hypothetical protein B7Y80_11670 [Hyphomicrobium sp. 32-62-53]|nr:MAG: hypothetical protein B7Y80_11670 [Hyphomicrobium sp. 32-62-53]